MRRLVVLAVLVVACLTCGQSAAAADDGSLLVDAPGDSAGFTHDPAVALVRVEKLAPGYSASSAFSVRNTSGDTARLVMTLVDMTDEENGCATPESREPGEGCEADGGELSGWLTATVSREDPSAETLWSGDFRDLAQGVELPDSLPAGGTWALRVTISMAEAATNATMTDLVSFGTRLDAERETGSSAVVGPVGSVEETRPGAPGGAAAANLAQAGPAPGSGVLGPLATGPRVALPMTGGSISLWMVLLDGFAIAIGLLLVSLSRARREPSHSRSRARRTSRSASVSPTPRARAVSTNA